MITLRIMTKTMVMTTTMTRIGHGFRRSSNDVDGDNHDNAIDDDYDHHDDNDDDDYDNAFIDNDDDDGDDKDRQWFSGRAITCVCSRPFDSWPPCLQIQPLHLLLVVIGITNIILSSLSNHHHILIMIISLLS